MIRLWSPSDGLDPTMETSTAASSLDNDTLMNANQARMHDDLHAMDHHGSSRYTIVLRGPEGSPNCAQM